MLVRIRANGIRLFIPVPAAMIGFAIKLAPDRLFDEARVNTPEPYSELITKENIRMILNESLDILRDNKGLEVVHVEASDGTFVSIRL